MSDLRSSEVARAEALVELRRWDEAVALLGTVVAADPSASRPRCLLAQALLGAKRPADALTQAGEAAAMDPSDEWPHRLRSIALLVMGDKPGAVAAAQEAARLAPGLVNPYLVLVDAELSRGHTTAAAAAAASKALELAPNRSGTHNALGRVALARRRNREAERHFREALRLAPEDPAALNNLGLALLRQGRRRAAVAYFASASKANPHDDLARRNAVQATMGFGGVGIGVIVVQAMRPASGNSGFGWTAALVAFLAVVVAVGAREHRLARRSGDPQASKELMRSLRRSASRRERFFPRTLSWVVRLSAPGLALQFLATVLLMIGAFVYVDDPVAYCLILAAAAVLGGFALATVIARRRLRRST